MPVVILRPVRIHWRLYKENGEASSVQTLKKHVDKNAAYAHGVMNVHSRVGNLFPNSQQLNEMAL
jgi:hypothetical protein